MPEKTRTSKLEILVNDYGTTVEQLLENAMMDGECPGICSRPGCNYTTEVEPDQGSGWCEGCGGKTVISALRLAGVI